MKILYKFATRSRPDKFYACIENIKALATYPDYHILVTADVDDTSMHDAALKFHGGKNVTVYYGTSLNKIDAINRDMGLAPDWDILINMSDDMFFIQPGFDSIIVQDFERYGLDTLLHYPDQAAGSALITMAIMGRKYYDRFGYIYNPEYKSLFCDNEQQEVAKLLGRYVFVKRRLFDHNHPAWGRCATDAQYIKTESFFYEDQATFNNRKNINFNIPAANIIL
jgi:hypothetical protein